MTFPIENPALQRALVARGYTEPTAVQLAVLEPDAEDRDLLVSAQTGSGKTVAYGLAFASTILGAEERLPRAAAPLVLVIAPTRELAIQVHGELTWLYAEAGGRVVSCVGGMDAREESRALSAGCHIVVGTPGRLQDHINRRRLDLSGIQVVVLDEADEMLDLGFKDELEFILNAAPESRRTLLFSATIAKDIAALARQYQQDALRIDTVSRNQPHADIEYRAVRVAGHEIELGLVNLLRYYDARGTLVFCATREAVRRLQSSLLERGFDAVSLSGELSQNERNNALQSLRDGRARVCIATDVAARGLDLPDLDLVIHADLPTNKATLLHRSGRTGRAGRKGVCLLLVPNSKRRRAEMLLASANINAAWADPPLAEEIRARDQERLLSDPVLTETPLDEDIALAKQLLTRQSPESIAAALIRLYRAKLPAPEELTVQYQPPVSASAARSVRAPREKVAFDAQAQSGPMNWFRASVGRSQNADPKWLIPLICRVGGITKQEIGVIRIFDRETKFEISASAAQRFQESVRAATNQDMVIEPSTPPGAGPARDPGPRPAKVKAAQPARPPRPPRAADAKPTEQERRRKNKASKYR
ncbi:MAG: helicase [Acidocella sp. 20-57-95]|nr:MAG: helicase [Acidocella sp. 20-57-95]OYV61771.1 MAG: helicase [Acidocella sp. 21-58-7]HQT65481.1 DEAD/DEAH box helicase [Acidocella sp.]HQU03446.1 DEAD/DEAH box helicase [Acidocella sp.]